MVIYVGVMSVIWYMWCNVWYIWYKFICIVCVCCVYIYVCVCHVLWYSVCMWFVFCICGWHMGYIVWCVYMVHDYVSMHGTLVGYMHVCVMCSCTCVIRAVGICMCGGIMLYVFYVFIYVLVVYLCLWSVLMYVCVISV